MIVRSMKAFGSQKNISIWLPNISKSNKKAPNPNFRANLIVIDNKNSSNVFEQKYIFISLSIKIEKTIKNICTVIKESTGNCKLKRQ